MLPGPFSVVRVTKDGFLPLTINTSHVDVLLTPSTEPAMIAGMYTLTIKASGTCTQLPIELRARTYTARIEQPAPFGPLTYTGGEPAIPFGLRVHLNNDAETCQALESLSQCGFFGGVVNDSVGFSLFNDWITGPDGSVLEVLGPGQLFTAHGIARGHVNGSVITMTFGGQLSVEGGSSSNTGGVSCRADDHQFTFVRQ